MISIYLSCKRYRNIRATESDTVRRLRLYNLKIIGNAFLRPLSCDGWDMLKDTEGCVDLAKKNPRGLRTANEECRISAFLKNV